MGGFFVLWVFWVCLVFFIYTLDSCNTIQCYNGLPWKKIQHMKSKNNGPSGYEGERVMVITNEFGRLAFLRQ